MYEWYMKTVTRERPLQRALHRGILDYVDTELCIVVPYISLAAVQEMVQQLYRKHRARKDPVRVRLIAAGDARAYLLGEGELAAVKYLVSPVPVQRNLAVEVRTVTQLHAKVYIATGQRALVSSANLTVNGLRRNKEAGILTFDTKMLGSIQSGFDQLWAAAAPVNIAQLEDAIKHLVVLQRKYADGIRLTKEIDKLILFHPMITTKPELPAQETLDLPDEVKKAVTASTPQPLPSTEQFVGAIKSLPVDIKKVGPTEVTIDKGSRYKLSLHLLTLAGGQWRLEIHRRGRPRGLAWESFVEPTGILHLAVVDDWLVLQVFGRKVQVDLGTLKPVDLSVDTVEWDAKVWWNQHGDLFADGSHTQIADNGESLFID